MPPKYIEKLGAGDTRQLSGLSLRNTSFIKPFYDSRFMHCARKTLALSVTKYRDGVIRHLKCHVRAHMQTLQEINPRVKGSRSLTVLSRRLVRGLTFAGCIFLILADYLRDGLQLIVRVQLN